MPFCPFCFRVPLLKLSIRKKGTLIVKGLLRNLGIERDDDGSESRLKFNVSGVRSGAPSLGFLAT